MFPKCQATSITGISSLFITYSLSNKHVFRHKQAQYAGRASVQLNILTYFKGKEETADGFIMAVRSNGIQVFIVSK